MRLAFSLQESRSNRHLSRIPSLPPEILPPFRQTFTEQASGPQPDICVILLELLR